MRLGCRSLSSAVVVLTFAALAPAADLQPDSAPVVPASQPGPAEKLLTWPAPGPASPRSVSRWYGGRTLLVDGRRTLIAAGGYF
jgi:hypothetical protein